MKKLIITAALLAASGLAQAGNYATCLLDKLPGLENDHAASAAVQVCRAKYPGGLESVQKGSGRGVFSFDSGADCALSKSGDTRSRDAAYMIRASCNRLFDEPNFFDQFDDS
ncbi:hypothetical protein ACIGFL_09215 [Pseudomonas sp. NPDC077649]|uniref:hypothetical protein n=1 Tax=Pseudomonas sp. NPDC077649 TaxID=3364423 RepID=UPI0037CA7F7E